MSLKCISGLRRALLCRSFVRAVLRRLARRYQSLRHFDEVPQLPSGYFGMFLLSYVPPLWRRVMDPKVLALAEGDMSRINTGPVRPV